MATSTKKKIEDTAEKVVKTAEKTAAKVADKAEKAAEKVMENPKVQKAAISAEKTAKKAASTAKKAASTAKKATEKVTAYVEFAGKQISTAEIADKVRAEYKAEGNKAIIRSIELYIKPEENTAYYVVNGNAEGKRINL